MPASVEPYPFLKPEIRYGNRQLSVGAGRPTGKELRFVEPLGGRGGQVLASDFADKATKGEYKPGFLVASATAQGFEKPWSILIDAGASCSYV